MLEVESCFFFPSSLPLFLPFSLSYFVPSFVTCFFLPRSLFSPLCSSFHPSFSLPPVFRHSLHTTPLLSSPPFIYIAYHQSLHLMPVYLSICPQPLLVYISISCPSSSPPSNPSNYLPSSTSTKWPVSLSAHRSVGRPFIAINRVNDRPITSSTGRSATSPLEQQYGRPVRLSHTHPTKN
jgi:hypothetical protein